ncbi:MAG: hypothetical protein GF400_04200 [Candidatus Eisenbacteria bacterium]|nr:hypothetical protein [Candidatus Eisenbacteria bacterium]
MGPLNPPNVQAALCVWLSLVCIVALPGAGTAAEAAGSAICTLALPGAGSAAEKAGAAPGSPQRPIAVDGDFGEWETSDASFADERGDADGLDLVSVSVRSDAARVAFLIELSPELNLQSGNELTLVIDADADASTGDEIHGVGAELVWTFGRRRGSLWRDGRMRQAEQSELGLLQAPTVSSDTFEVSFARSPGGEGANAVARAAAEDPPSSESPAPRRFAPGREAADEHGRLIESRVSFVLVDERAGSGDRLPDAGAATVALSDGPPPPPREVSLEKEDPDDIRVLTYNVLFDGLFKRPSAFLRILRAIEPDIICFQEIWSHTARQAADQVSLALPETTWHGAHTTEGQIVSRYPFIEHSPIDEAGNYWAVVDLPDETYDVDIGVVSAHPPCCEKEKERQEQLDAVAAWLRERTTGNSASLPRGTPIVVAGDMNLVGGSNQLRTLLAGEIVYEKTYGPSHPPDWDGTPLSDANPRLAGGLDNYTWRDGRSSFAPGKLDYIVYSDSALGLGNAFVLSTERLPREALERYGLRADDTLEASDHLPVVADFRPVSPDGAEHDDGGHTR